LHPNLAGDALNKGMMVGVKAQVAVLGL